MPLWGRRNTCGKVFGIKAGDIWVLGSAQGRCLGNIIDILKGADAWLLFNIEFYRGISNLHTFLT